MKKYKNDAGKARDSDTSGCKRTGVSRRSRKLVSQRPPSSRSAAVQGTNRARITEGRLSLCPKPHLLGGARHSTSLARQTLLPRAIPAEAVASAGDGPGIGLLSSSKQQSHPLGLWSSSGTDRSFPDDVTNPCAPVSSGVQCDLDTDRSLDPIHADRKRRLVSPGECETPSAGPVFEVPVMEDFITTVNTAVAGLLNDLTLSPRLAPPLDDPLAIDQRSLTRLWKQRCRLDDETGQYSRVAQRLRPELTTLSSAKATVDANNNNNSKSDDIPASAVSSPSHSVCAQSVRAAVDSACEQEDQEFVLRLCSSSQASSSQDALQLLRMCDEEENADDTGWGSSCLSEFRPDPVGLLTRPCSSLSPAPPWSPEAPPAFWRQSSGDLLDSLESSSTGVVDRPCCSTEKQSSHSFLGSFNHH